MAVYAVCAVGFHWVVEPAVKSQPVSPYEPSVATIVQPATSYVTPARSDVPSRVTSRPPASATSMAAAPRSESPRVAPQMAVTPAVPRATESSRSEPPPPMTVTSAAPQSTDGVRSEPASRVAPPMTIAAPKTAETAAKSAEAAAKPAEAAPKSAEMVPVEATAAVASEAAVTPEATEPVAPAPKKAKKTARKTPRHERQREFFNPMNFFAWGGNNGWRRF